jgi:hypothetical protein
VSLAWRTGRTGELSDRNRPGESMKGVLRGSREGALGRSV